MSVVNKLPKQTALALSTTQVITSASTAVKELVENAIDAGATNIEVKLENYGLDRIEVKDNGVGLSREDAFVMCKKSYTSKITQFDDLSKITSFGFRGEALNALCALGKVYITTITEGDDVAMTHEYDNEGNVITSKVSHIIKGTTVVVENLFRHLPVRKQLMSTGKRKAEELKKVELVVKALGLIHPKIRMVYMHNKFVFWQKNSVPTLKLSLSQVVAPTIVKQLIDIRSSTPKLTCQLLIPEKGCNVASTCYGNVGDAVAIFVNRRPVKHKKIEKMVQDEVCNYFGNEIPAGKYPTCVISLTLPPNALDANYEPNKTKVVITDEKIIMSLIKNQITEYYIGPLGLTGDFLNDDTIPCKRKPEEGLSEEEAKRAKKIIEEHRALEALPPHEKQRRTFVGPPPSPPSFDVDCTNPYEEGSKPSLHISKQKKSLSDESTRDKNIQLFLDPLVAQEEPANACQSGIKIKSLKSRNPADNEPSPEEAIDCKKENDEPEKNPSLPSSIDISSITLSQWSKGQIKMEGIPVNSSTIVVGTKEADDTPSAVDCTASNKTEEEPVSQASERSVSSQMGCKDMAGFTKFASEMSSKSSELPGDVQYMLALQTLQSTRGKL